MGNDVAKPDQWAHTELNFHSFSMGWKISGFSSLLRGVHRTTGATDRDFLESPIFTSDIGHNWRLSVSPTRNGTFLGIFVSFMGMSPAPTSEGIQNPKTLYRFRLLDSNDHEFIPTGFPTEHESKIFIFGTQGLNRVSGYNEFMRMDELVGPVGTEKGLLQNDTIRIICSLSVEGKLSGTTRNPPLQDKLDRFDLFQDLSRDLGISLSMASIDPLADATLTVGTLALRCHKSLLSARSVVFAKMFSSGMKEAETGIVSMEDFSVEVVQEFLRYVYTGEVGNLEVTAQCLLKLGDRFLVPGLKGAAEKFLLSELSVENAADLLLLGDHFQGTTLKDSATAFIQRNKKMVVETEGFRRVMKTNPIVIAQLFIA